jgi:excisionase family DNA binding protein
MHETAEGLTLAEAAAQLGVSTDTVRRRIQRGDLSARQVDTKFGPAWRVLLGSAPVPANGLHGSAPVGPGVVELVALVDKLQQQNLELAGRVGYYQAEVEQLRTTLKALQAPREELAAATVPAEEPPRPSWWRRLLLGE